MRTSRSVFKLLISSEMKTKIYLTNKYIILAVILFLVVGEVKAKIYLPSVISSNMVLQQNSDVNLWGNTEYKSGNIKIFTSWDNKKYIIKADNDGSWKISVKTPNAGGPYKIVLDDGDKIVLDSILIGEVWFCSGQSNMEMPMEGFDRQPVQNGNDVILKAKPEVPIRIFTTDSENGKWIRQYSKKPQSDCLGKWMLNTPYNVAHTSATAYFFAKYLQEVLEVPVGIIISSRGGSKIEAWMSRESLSGFKDLSFLDDSCKITNDTNTPCVLYNSKISPFTKFSIKGFLWYQGESNRDNAIQYKKLMIEFVKDLRNKWNKENLPFYYVEIAPYNYESENGKSAAYMREIQQQIMKEIPNSGMITTLDIGHPRFIHPVDKETVGKRLALMALGDTYKLKGFGYKTPLYKSIDIVGNKVYVNVDNAPKGLCPMWTPLSGFEISGDDKIFYPANAEIETKTARLVVYSEKVSKPVAVRYAFKNYVKASVFDVYGIPLAPFRTDKW